MAVFKRIAPEVVFHAFECVVAEKHIQRVFDVGADFRLADVQRRGGVHAVIVIDEPLRMILVDRGVFGAESADPYCRTESRLTDFVGKCAQPVREFLMIHSGFALIGHTESVRRRHVDRIAVIHLNPADRREILFQETRLPDDHFLGDVAEDSVVPGAPHHIVAVDCRCSVHRREVPAEFRRVSFKNAFQIVRAGCRAEIPFVDQCPACGTVKRADVFEPGEYFESDFAAVMGNEVVVVEKLLAEGSVNQSRFCAVIAEENRGKRLVGRASDAFTDHARVRPAVARLFIETGVFHIVGRDAVIIDGYRHLFIDARILIVVEIIVSGLKSECDAVQFHPEFADITLFPADMEQAPAGEFSVFQDEIEIIPDAVRVECGELKRSFAFCNLHGLRLDFSPFRYKKRLKCDGSAVPCG